MDKKKPSHRRIGIDSFKRSWFSTVGPWGYVPCYEYPCRVRLSEQYKSIFLIFQFFDFSIIDKIDQIWIWSVFGQSSWIIRIFRRISCSRRNNKIVHSPIRQQWKWILLWELQQDRSSKCRRVTCSPPIPQGWLKSMSSHEPMNELVELFSNGQSGPGYVSISNNSCVCCYLLHRFVAIGGNTPKPTGALSARTARRRSDTAVLVVATWFLWSCLRMFLHQAQMISLSTSSVSVHSFGCSLERVDCHREVHLKYCSACGTRYQINPVNAKMDHPQDNVRVFSRSGSSRTIFSAKEETCFLFRDSMSWTSTTSTFVAVSCTTMRRTTATSPQRSISLVIVRWKRIFDF